MSTSMYAIPHTALPNNRSERVVWVDYAKGICILLVLLLHANQELGAIRGDTGWVAQFVEFARPFRMPDFFLISGLFLSRVIDGPFLRYLDRRVVHFAYFYLLWAAFYFLLFGVKTALDQSGGDWSAVLPAYLLTYVQPSGSLWFIHALALFSLCAKLLHRLPGVLVLAVAAALQMADVHTGWTIVDEFCRRFIYFYSGYLLAPHIMKLAEWAMQNRKSMLLYLLGWAVVNQLMVVTGWAFLPGLGLVLGYLGAIAVVFCGVMLSRLSWMGALRYIGEYSIALYLADYFVQRVALKLGMSGIADASLAVLALTVTSVIGTLLMYQAALRLGIRFPYERPAWARLPAEPVRLRKGEVA